MPIILRYCYFNLDSTVLEKHMFVVLKSRESELLVMLDHKQREFSVTLPLDLPFETGQQGASL